MDPIFQYSDYREILKAELARRCRQNANYSQGAFSRDIKLRPSRLSEVLNGKQGLSATIAHEIAKCLNFSNVESNYFTDLVVSQHGRSKAAREVAAQRLLMYQEESASKLVPAEALTDQSSRPWHFLAVLELLADKNFRPSIHWIAEKLNIDELEAKKAMEQLEKHELWNDDESAFAQTNGKKTRYHVSNQYEDCRDNALHKDLLVRAIKEMEAESPDNRNLDSVRYTVFASIDPEQMGKYRSLLDNFLKELDKLKAPDGANTVYCFSSQMFPVTEKDF